VEWNGGPDLKIKPRAINVQGLSNKNNANKQHVLSLSLSLSFLLL
jgi:hypothetical protein